MTKGAGGSRGSAEHEMHATVPAEVSTVLAFYRRVLAERKWKEETQGAVLNADEVALTFSSAEGTAVLKLGHKYDLTTVSLVLQVAKSTAKVEPSAKIDSVDAILKQAQQAVREATAEALAEAKVAAAQTRKDSDESLRPLAANDAPIPLPETAAQIDFNGTEGKLEFNSTSNIKALAAFYRAAMRPLGWQESPAVIDSATMITLEFSKGRNNLSFTIMQIGKTANVTADGSGLITAAAKSKTSDAAPPAAAPVQSAAAPAPVAEKELEAEESGGLPVPTHHTMTAGEQTPFRRQVNASVPVDLAAVLAFYRRELGKRDWKEQTNGAVIAPDRAVLAFSSSDGPAVLKLGRKDGETTVNLMVRNRTAAEKAGMLPKSGQAKLLLGNTLAAEAAITINKQTIKVAAGAGSKGPDGPTLDLPPGKYKYSLKTAGRPAENDEVDIGADETWGLLIGPGGVLPLQMY